MILAIRPRSDKGHVHGARVAWSSLGILVVHSSKVECIECTVLRCKPLFYLFCLHITLDVSHFAEKRYVMQRVWCGCHFSILVVHSSTFECIECCVLITLVRATSKPSPVSLPSPSRCGAYSTYVGACLVGEPCWRSYSNNSEGVQLAKLSLNRHHKCFRSLARAVSFLSLEKHTYLTGKQI